MEKFEKKEIITTSTRQRPNGNQVIRKMNSSVGLFRDLPGYGKTLSLCVLMARDVLDDKINWDLSEPFERQVFYQTSDVIMTTDVEQFEKCDCSVVICSPNLIQQWKIELERCGLIYYEVNNTASITRIPSIAYLNENIHVLIVSTNFVGDYFQKYGEYAYRRIIYDEIADTKVPGASNCQIIANFYWFVSATIYRRLRHNSSSVFTRLLPSYYDTYERITVMNDPSFITQSITLPKPKSLIHIYSPNAVVTALGEFLDPRVIYLIKTGNILEALTYMRATDNENIFDVVIRRCDEKINRVRAMSPGEHRTLRLAEATKEKENILERMNGLNEKECNICYTIPEESIISPCCYQVFCSECYLRSLNSSHSHNRVGEMRCCMCRSKVELSKLIKVVPKVLDDAVVDMQVDEASSSSAANQKAVGPTIPTNNINNEKIKEIIGQKTQQETLILLLKQLCEIDNRKILIFSEHDSLYELVKEKMFEHNQELKIHILRGIQTHRENLINDFRFGTLNMLYLNSVINASGINLPEATDIILCHTMPKNVKDQIVGRAVRIGCKHEVCVHELICYR